MSLFFSVVTLFVWLLLLLCLFCVAFSKMFVMDNESVKLGLLEV